MGTKYVQFPPLPLDMSLEAIEMLWTYARMREEERGIVREFIRECVDGRTKEIEKAEFVKRMEAGKTEQKQELAEYNELMKKLIGSLIAQACEAAGIVYQNYCLEGKSIEKISDEFAIDQELIYLIVQYYDKKD